MAFMHFEVLIQNKKSDQTHYISTDGEPKPFHSAFKDKHDKAKNCYCDTDNLKSPSREINSFHRGKTYLQQVRPLPPRSCDLQNCYIFNLFIKKHPRFKLCI